MSKAVAVLISDIHYSLPNLALADAALRQAINKANELQIPLIVAGDLHDSKANMRAECVNAMLETFKLCTIKPYVMIGNHDKTNEKSRPKEHSLHFLAGLANIVDTQWTRDDLRISMIPYQSDPEYALNCLRREATGNRKDYAFIMHQGVQGSLAGDYIIDKSALPREAFKDFRVISGHYHTRQDIRCGPPSKGAVGLFSYIGNPYTLGFGEANDPEKGYQILMDDGTLEFIPTNLRRHYIVNWDLTNDDYTMTFSDKLEPILTRDICWVKVHGTKERLSKVEKRWVRNRLFGPNPEGDFRLDLIPNDTETKATQVTQQMSSTEALDTLIQSMDNVSDEQKVRLKELWRQNASN